MVGHSYLNDVIDNFRQLNLKLKIYLGLLHRRLLKPKEPNELYDIPVSLLNNAGRLCISEIFSSKA